MRRRVIELDRGTLVRDQARGVYGIDRPRRRVAPRAARSTRPKRPRAGSADAGLRRVRPRETASNLWRNRLMTVAAVLTVAVSLALVGAALLLKQGASKARASGSGARRSPCG